jgi:hypothetical protein
MKVSMVTTGYHRDVRLRSLLCLAALAGLVGSGAACAAGKDWPKPVRLVRQDLARHLQVSVASVKVVKVERVTWRDACLGLPSPELCAQVLTPGFRVTLGALGRKYRYHTDLNRAFRYAGPGDSPKRPGRLSP